MRLWHYELLPYLPDLQFKGQLRELVAVMRDWRDKGTTNHLLINRVMEYPKEELYNYANIYFDEYYNRYENYLDDKRDEFYLFSYGGYWVDDGNGGFGGEQPKPFICWHNKEYLRICMANLYEKHQYAVGKSQITNEEWQMLLQGYKNITGEDYKI